jgi:malonyl CoA-acyl carrier protein transacylase
MKTYMFPGQGAQRVGMGGGLFDRFRELTDRADEILGYSLRQLCLEDRDGLLDNTQYTQPALYAVNALTYYARLEDVAEAPDFAAGHSLGEFDALLVAGCFDFDTGLRLVKKRGELMGQVANGGMAAVLNASPERIEQILRDNRLDSLHLANFNSSVQIVISGLAEQIERAQAFFRQDNMRYFPLNASGPFHSPFMRTAMEAFRAWMEQFQFRAPQIPVIANRTARPYRDDAIVDTLAGQIASPVRWSDSIQYLLAVAAARGRPMDFVELGQGDVLTRLLQTIREQTSDAQLRAIDAAADMAAADAPKALVSAPSAHDRTVEWNRRFPVGTRVRSPVVPGQELATRTPAMVLFGHRAAIYIQGYNGYFDLDELTPA